MAYYKVKTNENIESYDYKYCCILENNTSLINTWVNNSITNLNNYVFGKNNITNMANAFYNCNKLTTIRFANSFSTQNTFQCFFNCVVFNCPVNNLLINATNTGYTFYNCVSFNQPVNCYNTVNMYRMFYGCTNFNQKVYAGTVLNDASSAFYLCRNLNTPQTFSNLNNGYQMFYCCYNLNCRIDGAGLNHIAKNFAYMFYCCNNLNCGLGNNVLGDGIVYLAHNANDCSYMFYGCTKFNQNVNFSYRDTVTNCQYMFYGCSNLKNKFITFYGNSSGTIVNMSYMFYGCSGNLDIYIRGSNVSINTYKMFSNLYSGGYRVNIHLGNASLWAAAYWKQCMDINIANKVWVSQGYDTVCWCSASSGSWDGVQMYGGCSSPYPYTQGCHQEERGYWQTRSYIYNLEFSNNTSNGCMYNAAAGIYIYK